MCIARAALVACRAVRRGEETAAGKAAASLIFECGMPRRKAPKSPPAEPAPAPAPAPAATANSPQKQKSVKRKKSASDPKAAVSEEGPAKNIKKYPVSKKKRKKATDEEPDEHQFEEVEWEAAAEVDEENVQEPMLEADNFDNIWEAASASSQSAEEEWDPTQKEE